MNDVVFNNLSFDGILTNRYSFIPFFRNGRILSSAEYKMGDRFTFGGFSYGANSIFSVPSFNPVNNKFDIYGSTLFLQYKISKNFKIETRVNVNKGPGPGF